MALVTNPTPPWNAPPLGSAHSPAAAVLGSEWKPLVQAWQVSPERDATLRRGTARVLWEPSALIFEARFTGVNQRNRATALNQRTWELGDVCEVFVFGEDMPAYLEVHVTPENQRLQLRFPPGAIEEVRAGRATLASFMVPDPSWVETSVTLMDAEQVLYRIRIPTTSLGLAVPLAPGTALRAAVCRYDYGASPDGPVLSSTAPLREPFFHRFAEWSPLCLQPRTG